MLILYGTLDCRGANNRLQIKLDWTELELNMS